MSEELEALLEVPISVYRAHQAVRVLRDSCDCDPEAAHLFEDRFRASVLETVASNALGVDKGIELAKLALSTRDIKFPRWVS